MAHGGGGRLMNDLIRNVFLPAFGDPALADQHDGAVLPLGSGRLAFTTDSYVVKPLFFPGGDIGSLSVNGTVNDLAMCGARPLYLSAGMIVEEGLSMEVLARVAASMRKAADAAGVRFVTGDTKVVDRGKGDGLYLNTAGIGIVEHGLDIRPSSVMPGDAIVLSGDIGRHGVAIMAQREGLAFETTLESDCAPLHRMVQSLLKAGLRPHCLRDLTRGGLGSALIEISETSRLHLHVDATAIPVHEAVRGACEMLGLDPVHVANEGRMIAVLPAAEAERAAACMRSDPAGAQACVIGGVTESPEGMVTIASEIGADRILDLPSGEQLPRIC
jgi:hydrogenase expression/formation protein HypE